MNYAVLEFHHDIYTIYNIMHAEGNITCRSTVERLYI